MDIKNQTIGDIKLKVKNGEGWDWETEEARAMHKEITQIFEIHFPKLETYEYCEMTSQFLAAYNVSLLEVWNYEKEQEKLAKLKYQVRKISELYNSIPQVIKIEIQGNSTLPVKVLNGSYTPSSNEDDIFQFNLAELPSYRAFQALEMLSSHFEDLLPVLERTSEDLPRGIDNRKRAIEAWRLVEATAEICRSRPDTINVPKFMNEAGQFYHLLEDLFIYFDIGKDSVSAFKAWRKHVDSIREDLDLLPM